MAENNNKEVLKAVEKLSGKFDHLSGKVEKLSGTVDHLSGKVEKLSGKVDDVSEAIQTLATHMDKRFEAAEKSVDKKIGKLRSDLIDHVERTVGNAKGDII